MQTAYLGLGSNLGDRWGHLRAAVEGVRHREGLWKPVVSPVYETEAHTTDPSHSQPDFLNAVLEVKTDLAPARLLDFAHLLEREEGRSRTGRERWAPRPLDVDLLAVGKVVRRTDRLTLPHPRLAERRFVLRPWADLAPTFVVPSPFEETVQALLAACPDDAPIERKEDALEGSSE